MHTEVVLNKIKVLFISRKVKNGSYFPNHDTLIRTLKRLLFLVFNKCSLIKQLRKKLIFTSNMLNIVDLYIRVNLRLSDAAFEMQLSFYDWGQMFPLKTVFIKLIRERKYIILFINITGVKFYQTKHMGSLICFVILCPPQTHHIAHYSALDMCTITCLNTCKDPIRHAIIRHLCFQKISQRFPHFVILFINLMVTNSHISFLHLSGNMYTDL